MKPFKRIGQRFAAALVVCLNMIATVTAQSPDYARQVQPILHQRCASCHGEKAPQAALTVLTRAALLKGGKSGPAIVPGSSKASLLIQHVTGEKLPLMPMGGEPLKAEEIAVLKSWIDAGAEWSGGSQAARWEPPLAPRNPSLPDADAGLQNPIDRFVAAYFKQKDLSFPKVVDDRTFARRVYLDLWGLLPTPEQLGSFLKDQEAAKRAQLADQLLAEPRHYSQHWISFWNDLLRNDEGVIYHGERQSISPWLLKALEDNMPYDRLVSALLNPAKPSDPAGFLIGVNWRGDVSASQTPPMQAAQNSAQVFMGVNLKCASCHDSFINRWKLRESYGLASFFSEGELELVRCDVKLGEIAQIRFLYPELGSVPSGASLEERREAAARLMTLPENGRFARTLVNRYWERLFGRGLVEPLDDMDSEPWNAELLDWLACDFADHGYDLKHLLKQILTSQTYQLPAVLAASGSEKEFTFQGPQLRRLTAEQFVDAVSSVTGEWRVLEPKRGEPGVYSRDWRLKSSSLTRALGRPIRDQVFTSRNEEASTLQALELVNGEDLAYLLRRGARRMLGELDPAPANLFDSGPLTKGKAMVDVDLAGAKELWLLMEDVGSYDSTLVVAGWAGARLTGPEGEVPLKQLASKTAPPVRTLRIDGQEFPESLVAPAPAELVIDLKGKDYARFQAVVGVDDNSMRSDIGPRVRFFVFTEKPDYRQLVRVSGESPVPAPARLQFTVDGLTDRVYQHILSRAPNAGERRLAGEFLTGSAKKGKIPADGLEDLLWSLFMSPEFQFIQ
jgi:mono/diheme cytochrome c family protein